MLSAIVAGMIFCGLVVLVLGLSMIKLRKHWHRKPAPDPLDRHVTMILHMQDGVVVGVEKPTHEPRFSLPTSWYSRFRVLVSLGFLIMILVTLFVQSGLADGAIKDISHTLSLFTNANIQATDLHTAAHQMPGLASQRLTRVYQLDPAQYASQQEYNTWAYGACSAAAMTAIFDAYGRTYRITDVLKVESRIGEITPADGLLRPAGIAYTATQFGFQTDWGPNWSYDRLITTANQGTPVIVDFPPYKYAGGHILVVTGGNSTTVFLADSSYYNRHTLPYAQFMNWWNGYGAAVTPM